LAALAPDVILATGDSTVPPLLQATRTVPIVFPVASDPVGGGYVDGLARPGGNATGFMIFEYGMAGKWMELLKEIAPNLTRVAVLRDPASCFWSNFRDRTDMTRSAVRPQSRCGRWLQKNYIRPASSKVLPPA
jgi:ABC-type uncharacterized transport system substrate-binding protein